MVGVIERRDCIRARDQTFNGRESDYHLHPYHLLADHGNWYLLAHNEKKGQVWSLEVDSPAADELRTTHHHVNR